MTHIPSTNVYCNAIISITRNFNSYAQFSCKAPFIHPRLLRIFAFFFFFPPETFPKSKGEWMRYELPNNRTVKVVEGIKKKKAKQRPGSLPILIPFLGIDSNRPNWAPTVCIDLHWWSRTTQPNSSRFRVLRSPQLATRCVKERSPPTTTSGLVFVSPPENKGWAPRGR